MICVKKSVIRDKSDKHKHLFVLSNLGIMKFHIVSPLLLVLAAIFPSTTIRRPDWKRSESMEWVGLETKFDDISGQVQAIKEKIGY